jgi:hypothetical protein
MKKTIVTEFKDLDAGDNGLVIIRYDNDSVVIGLSLESNGDMQVVLKRADAQNVIKALEKAVHSSR